MNLSDVAEEIAARLDTVDGLRAYSYPPGSLNPPTAIVLNPEPGGIVYDQTYGRGMDRMTLPLLVIVRRSSERAATKNVRPFLDSAGQQSIKEVLESGTYGAFDTIRVVNGGWDGVTWGDSDYVAALFDLDITGQGRPR